MSSADEIPLTGPGYLFSRIARGLSRIGDGRLRTLGFASAQLPVLAALKDGRKLSQAELVRLARVEQPSMAQLLARMERDGIVRREPDPDDRRRSLVMLTDAACGRLPEGRAVLEEITTQALSGLSNEEAETLTLLLPRVLANVEAMYRD